MSSPSPTPAPSNRPLQLGLGNFARGNISPSPPVHIPKKSIQFGRPVSSTAPNSAAHYHAVSGGHQGYHSTSLIGPVMDDSEVMSTSSVSSSSSTIMRHKEAATGLDPYTGIRTYGSTPAPVGGKGLDKSINYEDTYENVPGGKRYDHPTTNFQTFIHVLKGNIGTGLLALPLAVRNAGLVLGPIGLLVMGLIATHCMLLLLDVAKHLCKQVDATCLNYAEAASVAVGQHTSNKRATKAAALIVNIFLVITQFGFCCVYFVFIGDSINVVFCEALDVSLGKQAWIGILIVPVMIFSWIRNLEGLAPFSLVANLCILFCFAVILYEEIYAFVGFAIDERAAYYSETFKYVGTVQTIALFFGSAIYAFEGIGMVLPLENKMKDPNQAKPVMVVAMAMVILLYFSFGTLGYIVFGNEVNASITLDLKSQTRLGASIVFIIVKLYFAYAIFASYLLQFYVPMDFLEPSFLKLIKVDLLVYYYPQHHEKLKKLKTLIRLTFRSVLVVLTAAIAIAIPDLGDLISLVGAIASSALALIFPALLEIITFWPKESRQNRFFLWKCPWQVWVVKDGLILLLGVVGLILGTYASIANIIQHMGNADGPCKSIYRH